MHTKNYWLMKSEPTAFSIDDLMNSPKQISPWDGVRNYQARNMMRDQMKPGDLAFFYHSSIQPAGVVGVMEIVKEAYPDFTAFDPENPHYDPNSTPDKPCWFMVDVHFIRKFERVITLQELKQQVSLRKLPLVQRGSRLSIMPLTSDEWQTILQLEKREH